MIQQQKPCVRCLLEAAGRLDVYESVKQCIERIPAAQRTADEEYANRIAVCEACEHIDKGTCLKCGCYVQLRAAKSDAHCPLKKRKW